MQPATNQRSLTDTRSMRAPGEDGLFPGLLLAGLLALLGYLSADWLRGVAPAFGPVPVSPIVIAILLGVLIRNVTGFDATCEAGLRFSQCRLLQTGIVLLGIRLSLGEFAAIGISSIPLIVICIGVALVMITMLGRRLGLSPQLATLIAAGTSICGATAIVTAAPIVGARNHEVSYAIACITLFGIVATLAYPLGANWLFAGDSYKAGLFLGTAVHDTAQVIGAGMIYQNLFGADQALDTATVTKLLRNLSMLIVIPLLSILFRRSQLASNGSATKPPHWTRLVPLFVVGFALMSVLRTIGDLGTTPFGILTAAQWDGVITASKKLADGCLLIAMAAVGLNTRLAGLRSHGLKPLGLGLAAAATVGLVSSAVITLFY
jgi:uncharacterized integral membrane protein (TIGR00698 family)